MGTTIALLEGAVHGGAAGAAIGIVFGESVITCARVTYPESEEILTTMTVFSGLMGGTLGTLFAADPAAKNTTN